MENAGNMLKFKFEFQTGEKSFCFCWILQFIPFFCAQYLFKLFLSVFFRCRRYFNIVHLNFELKLNVFYLDQHQIYLDCLVGDTYQIMSH